MTNTRLIAAATAAFALIGCDDTQQEIKVPEPPFAEGAKPVACVMDGVDFGGQNDQELTWYANESRFLNGSFESGGRYWRNNFSGCDIRKSCIYEGDAHTGRRCLWVRGMDFVSSHGLGIRPGRYTISWWAKKPPEGRAWSGVSLWSQIGMRDAHGKLYGGKGNDRPLTDEWQKFSWTFDWKETGLSIRLSGGLIDDVQLSPAGENVPDLVNPFGLEIRTSDGEGRAYCDISKPFSVALDFSAPADATGTMDVEVTDFFKRTLKTLKDVPFAGSREVPLWERGVFPYRGVFDVRVHVKPAKGVAFVDHLRFAAYKFADATAANRFLHQIPGNASGPHQTEYYRQMRSLGVVPRDGGSGNTFPPEWLEKGKPRPYWYKDWATIAERGRQVEALGGLNCGWVLNPMTDHYLRDCAVTNISQYEEITAETAKRLEDCVAKTVAAFPWIDIWVSPNEVSGHWTTVKKGRLEDYARALMAMQNGVRRSNPKAKFLAYSTCNLEEQGRREIFDCFAAAQRLVPGFRFDAVDVHPYRPFPDNPDLDEDINVFNAMMARLGYTKDFQIWGLEGCYYFPFIMKQWNDIGPWAGTAQKDCFYHFGMPGYSLGWGERIASAMMLRDKLILYKHAPQTRGGTAWGIDMLDAQHVMAPFVATAAQTELLGNATFLEDIRFAPNCRAYVYDDHAGHAVAAFWRADEACDRGKKACGTVRLAGLDGVEVFDMMGNKVKGMAARGASGTPTEGAADCRGATRSASRDEELTLPLSGFPVYLRLPIGRAKEFAAAFNTSETPGLADMPVGFDFKMHDLKNLRISVDNPLTRPFAGTYSFADGKAHALTLGPRESKTVDYTFAKPLEFGKINKISFPMTVKGGEASATREYRFNVLPIPYSKGKPDWSKLPLVKLEYRVQGLESKNRGEKFGGDEDFSGGFKVAWNEEHLYIRFDIRDDKFALKLLDRFPENWWANDAMQMFFDTFGDGPMKAIRGITGFDGNDMSYDVMPTNETSAVVFRRHVPDHQLTGGVQGGLLGKMIEPGVACDYRFDAAKGTRTVELDFPARLLRPMRFEAGSAPGFAVKVMDRDDPKPGDYWHAGTKGWLTNIDPKVGDAFGTMHEYATMLFMK